MYILKKKGDKLSYIIGSLDLIQKMLNRDVDKRYNIHQVLEHPWLNQSQPIADH